MVTEVHRKRVPVLSTVAAVFQWILLSAMVKVNICLMKGDQGTVSVSVNYRKMLLILIFRIFGDILWQEYILPVRTRRLPQKEDFSYFCTLHI